MGAPDEKENGKEKEKENEKEEDENAQAVKHWSRGGAQLPPYELEDLVARGSPRGNFPCSAHALEPDNEDYSEDLDPEDYELSEKCAAFSISDQISGERGSQQGHELRAPGAPLAVPMVSSLKSLVSLSEQRWIRLGLPSKGHLADDTLLLLKDCGLPVKRDSPQQYVATIPELPDLRVFFLDSEEIVKSLASECLDIGIVGLHTVNEYERGNEDLIILHKALGCGHCRLSLTIPEDGIFERIESVEELAQMPQWTEENPLRVVTGLPNLGNKFMQEKGPEHVKILTAREPLEAAPAMGSADVILNIVSSETELRKNKLKEIKDGIALKSQAVLVASSKSLVQQEGIHGATRKIFELLGARLKAVGQVKVTAYMMGISEEEVRPVLMHSSLSVLQKAFIKAVLGKDGKVVENCLEIVCWVPEEALYDCMRELRLIRKCEILVSPLTHIFDEEPPKWQQLLSKLGL